MLVVAALGGNALLRRGEPPETTRQVANIRTAARALAEIAHEHDLVVTHGNGPQVGLLAMQSGDPLFMLSAETEGMIGYLIETALRNELPGRDVAGVLTQIAVDIDDPALQAPSKPIGPVYSEAQAKRLAREHGWTVAPDDGGYRHVVPSPRPLRILEIDTIRLLVRNGILVICAGGGGIPVVAENTGWRGIEAVIDKDHASALLARELGADALLMLTDVDAVYADWDDGRKNPLGAVTVKELRGYDFAPGSMGPKVEAAIAFAEASGKVAGIGRLQDAAAILRGDAGTRVTTGRP